MHRFRLKATSLIFISLMVNGTTIRAEDKKPAQPSFPVDAGHLVLRHLGLEEPEAHSDAPVKVEEADEYKNPKLHPEALSRAKPLEYRETVRSMLATLKARYEEDKAKNSSEEEQRDKLLSTLDTKTLYTRATNTVTISLALAVFLKGGRQVAVAKRLGGLKGFGAKVGGRIAQGGSLYEGYKGEEKARKDAFDKSAKSQGEEEPTETMTTARLRELIEMKLKEMDDRSFRIKLAEGRIKQMEMRLKSNIPWKDEDIMIMVQKRDVDADQLLVGQIRLKEFDEPIKFLDERIKAVRMRDYVPGVASAAVGGLVWAAEKRLFKIPGAGGSIPAAVGRFATKTVRTTALYFGGTEVSLGTWDVHKLEDQRDDLNIKRRKITADLKDKEKAVRASDRAIDSLIKEN